MGGEIETEYYFSTLTSQIGDRQSSEEKKGRKEEIEMHLLFHSRGNERKEEGHG